MTVVEEQQLALTRQNMDTCSQCVCVCVCVCVLLLHCVVEQRATRSLSLQKKLSNGMFFCNFCLQCQKLPFSV